MRFNRPYHADEAEFDLTAMIDIVLLLIIFFALTVRFVELRASPLNLPTQRGDSGAVPPAQGAIVVDVLADGTYRVMGANESVQWVAQHIASMVKSSPDPANVEVIVRAERSAQAAHVNRLAALLSQLGVRRWRLGTDAENASAPQGGGA